MDENGEPVSGATVIVKGTTKGTTTNSDGVFVLKGVDENAILVISHVQYETMTLPVKGNSFVNATLQSKVSALDELQVIAYGTTTKRFQTGNVSTIKSKDIEKQPVNNPLLALQGRVPGLFITQANGISGRELLYVYKDIIITKAE